MCTIMHNMHKYVPQAIHPVVYQGEDLPVDEDFYHRILFGGDQLTVYRSWHNLQEAMMTVQLDGWRVLQQ